MMLAADALPHNNTHTSDQPAAAPRPAAAWRLIAASLSAEHRRDVVGRGRALRRPRGRCRPKIGPASTVSVSPTAMSAPVGTSIPTGIRPTSSRSANGDVFGVVEQGRRAPPPARSPSGASARARQNALRPHPRHHVQRQQAGDHAAADQQPGQHRAVLRAGLQQRDLADETGERRNATEIERGHHEHERQQRAGRRQPAEPLQRRCDPPAARSGRPPGTAWSARGCGAPHSRSRRTGRARWTARRRTPCSRCG